MSKLKILDGIEVHGNVESNHVYAETYRTSRGDGDIYIQAATSSDFVSIGTEGGNNNLLRVQGNGNVGIGTTSPSHKLDIYSNSNVPLRLHRPENANLNSSGAWGIGFSTRNDASTSTSDTRAGIFSYYNGNLFLATGTSSIIADPDAYARLTVNSAGNVGIGTMTPSAKLDVVGDIELTQHLKATGNNLSFSAAGNQIMNIDLNGKVYPSTDSSYDLGFSSTLAWRNLYVDNVYANNCVGIGTTSPNAVNSLEVNGQARVVGAVMVGNSGTSNTVATGVQVHLKNTGAAKLRLEDSDSTNLAFDLVVNDGEGFSIVETVGGDSGDDTRFFIEESTGYVGIATTSPHAPLVVNGAIDTSDVTNGTFRVYNGSTFRGGWGTANWAGNSFGNSSNDLVAYVNGANKYFIGTNGQPRLTVAGDGDVGIGVTSPTNKLQVNGAIYSHTNIFAAATIGNKSTNKGINFENPQESVQTARIDSDRLRFYFGGSGGVGETVTFNENGTIGVNTTSPHSGTKMQICGGDTSPSLNTTAIDDTALVLSNSDDDYGMVFATDGSGKGYIQQRRTATATYYDLLLQAYGGSVGIGTTSPGAKLHVQPASNGKITKFGNDVMTQYTMTGQTNHTLTLTCGSYYQAEVIITANQTNGGAYNNLYIRGIWHNNHESHHWEEIEHIGELGGSSFTITVSQNTTSNSGKLVIQHNYSSASFAQAVIRVTDFYNTHAYTLT